MSGHKQMVGGRSTAAEGGGQEWAAGQIPPWARSGMLAGVLREELGRKANGLLPAACARSSSIQSERASGLSSHVALLLELPRKGLVVRHEILNALQVPPSLLRHRPQILGAGQESLMKTQAARHLQMESGRMSHALPPSPSVTHLDSKS